MLAVLLLQTALGCPASSMDEGIVCGIDGVTYSSKIEAEAKEVEVMHCGPCGKCSNQQDINIYNQTKDTLTATTTKCAWLGFLGRSLTQYCMDNFVGFTEECNSCWMDNIFCDMEKCKWTCLKYKLLGIGEFENGLDPCLNCDEQNCGPAFKQCAGANRRRCGIVTDIERDSLDFCNIAKVN